ncbi:MAG: hypothetical protein LBM08_05960 [Dysgonamonadaceae bacterium]|jgi:hypothetical protein|nr:hypothetical protein [Dysgonamonadaceae bacterium]
MEIKNLLILLSTSVWLTSCDAITGGVLGGTFLTIYLVAGLLPQLITTLIMSNKGYSGCLWFILSFFLSWIGVIIALCMPNVRRQEQRHYETIAAISSRNQSPQNITINDSRGQSPAPAPAPPPASAPVQNYRLKAIRNLKELGQPFDEYDIELETEKIKKAYEESKREEIAEQEQKQREEQVRMEEEARNRQEIKNKKRTQVLTKVAIVIGAVLLLGALSFTVIYFLKNRQLTQEVTLTVDNLPRSNKIEDILSQLVIEWSNAHSLNSTGRLIDLYHSEALLYGQQLKKDKIYGQKLSLLQKANGFEHKIYGTIDIKYINDNEYRCDFVKRVTINQKTNDYPSYLIFRKFNNQWKIVVEGDEITDKNLIKRKVKEIRNFPEVKRIRNLVIHEFNDNEAYYAVRVGEDMGTYLRTIYWFHIYKNPYKIMYYDAASNSEMTIKQWRNL